MINEFLHAEPKRFPPRPPRRRSSAEAMARRFQKLRGPVSPSRMPMEEDAGHGSTSPDRAITSSQRDEVVAREFSRAKRDVVRGKKPLEQGEPMESSESEQEQPKEVKKTTGRLKQPPPEEFLKIFMERGFAGTRYPHSETCKKLGIARDVEYLYEMGGLSTFLSRQFEAYKEETCHLLSSLKVHFYEDEPEYESDGGPGFITFTCRGLLYSLTIRELDTLYGFTSGADTQQDIDHMELQQFWSTIGKDNKPFSSSRSKSSQIRSPVVRYLHKAIASTLFARRVTGNINEGELHMLDLCLKGVLGFTREGLEMQGDRSDTSLTFVLLGQLLNYKDWALRMHRMNSKGELSIGGIITPILVACGVELRSEPYLPRWIDIEFLGRCGFLDRNCPSDQFIYKFTHLSAGEAKLRLPCTDLTKVRSGENIDFSPPLDRLYNPYEEEIHSEEDSPVYAGEGEESRSEQFGFEDYNLPVRSSPALKEAHKRIGILQRWNKFQGKAIATLKGTVKDLKHQMKEVKDQLKHLQSKPSGPPPAVPKRVILPTRVLLGSGSFREESRPIAPVEPPRASSFEPRQQPKQYTRRKRRGSGSGQHSSTAQLDHPGRAIPSATSGATSRFEHQVEPSSHVTYTRESMEDSISSFFSNP